MFAKQFAAGLVATALLSTTALAQAPAPAREPAPAQSSSMPRAETAAQPVQNQSASEWRASKVLGLYVYNDANERLGSINELLTDSNGKIAKAVIGVGGFLGIGESDVAVNFDQLKFVNEPMRTSSTTTSPAPAGDRPVVSADRPTTVGSTATTTITTASKPSINPDHAKLSMTKEQLQALPQFKFAN